MKFQVEVTAPGYKAKSKFDSDAKMEKYLRNIKRLFKEDITILITPICKLQQSN